MATRGRFEKNPEILKSYWSDWAKLKNWPEKDIILLRRFIKSPVVSDYGDIKDPKPGIDKFRVLETRIKWQQQVIDHVTLDGHWMEFGVRDGNSIGWLLQKRPDQEIHGFDSWEGLPEDWDVGVKEFPKGSMSVPVPEFKGHNVHCWKGWFKDTIDPWKEKHQGQIAYLHIDSDLYSSAKCVLNKLNDRIVPGTLIVFDELANFRLSGKLKYWHNHEWKALVEWLQQHDRQITPVLRTPMYQAACVVIK